MKDDEVRPEPYDPADVPEYPEGPLPAMKHYGITYFTCQKIVEELDTLQYPGYMVGLKVGYAMEDGSEYEMKFGIVDLSDEDLEQQEKEPDLPVSDEFLIRLYQTVQDYMKANVPDGGEKLNPEIAITMSGSLIMVRMMCRPPEFCDRGHTGSRWCKKVNLGSWTCLHSVPCA